VEKELEITQAVAQLGSCTIRRNGVQAAYSTVAPGNDYLYNGKELNGDYGIGSQLETA